MSWISESIYGKKGRGEGQARATHQLTEAKQGNYHYVYGPYAEPVMKIKPGDIVVAETKDAFEGKIKKKIRQPHSPAQCTVSQSTMRTDRSRGSGERRRACGSHPFDQAQRTAACRHHSPHSGVRRTGRQRRTRPC